MIMRVVRCSSGPSKERRAGCVIVFREKVASSGSPVEVLRDDQILMNKPKCKERHK